MTARGGGKQELYVEQSGERAAESELITNLGVEGRFFAGEREETKNQRERERRALACPVTD